MVQRDRHNDTDTARRTFLKTLGGTAVAISVSGPSVRSETSTTQQLSTPQSGGAHKRETRPQLSGIDPQHVENEYRSRNLNVLSDADLYREAAAIISPPQQKGINSFALHAPLELLARYGLLPFVEPQERPLARLQIVTSAATYESGVETVSPAAPVKDFVSWSAARQDFSDVLVAGDSDRLEALMLKVAAQFGTTSLVRLLTPQALPTLTGASHSHIGLWLLLKHGVSGDVGDAALLRSAVRRVAADPEGKLSSFDGMSMTDNMPLAQPANIIEAEILDKLAQPERGKKQRGGIRRLMEAGERQETLIASSANS